jgi:serine/threonine-protein kinase
LVHPNVVTIHAIGEERGFHFLEMEFVAGRSLQQLIQDEGRLTPVRATTLTTQIADGLAVAHQAGIVHRDLKPDNVLLTHRGVPKIADFGLAKRIVAEDGTSTEPLMGTPNFMAPELFNRQGATPCSDVYALGVCYFLLLTGRLPFVRGTLRELQHSAAIEPLPNVRALCPDIPLEMAECASLMLAKSPQNRPRDGIEASQLLHAVSGQLRDIESLLTEAFGDAADVCWTRTGHCYRLELKLPDGRRQTLFVEPSDHSATERLLLIYSVCCNAQPEYYKDALRLNSEISHGGLAIRDIDGESKFVMVDTYPRATVDAEEIRRSALEVAYRADAVEKLLTGLDHN